MLQLPHPKQDRKKAPRRVQSHRHMTIPSYRGRWPFIGSNSDRLRGMSKSALSATSLIIEATGPADVLEPSREKLREAKTETADAAASYLQDKPLRTVAIAASIGFVMAILAR